MILFHLYLLTPLQSLASGGHVIERSAFTTSLNRTRRDPTLEWRSPPGDGMWLRKSTRPPFLPRANDLRRSCLKVARGLSVNALLCAVRRIPLLEIGTDANFSSAPPNPFIYGCGKRIFNVSLEIRSTLSIFQSGQDARDTPAVLRHNVPHSRRP